MFHGLRYVKFSYELLQRKSFALDLFFCIAVILHNLQVN